MTAVVTAAVEAELELAFVRVSDSTEVTVDIVLYVDVMVSPEEV